MVATTIYSVTINITIIIYYTSSQHKLKNIHRVPKKGDTKLMVVTLLTLKFSTNFQTFFTVWFSSKFAAKYLLKTPPHLICVTTLPCENFTSEDEQHSQTNAIINDKLHGTVVTYLRRIFFKSVHIWQLQKGEMCVHFHRLLAVWWPGA